MIIDSHAYCFTAPDTPAGHPSAEAHLALWQVQTALHHQPAFRTRDRQRGDSRRLLAPAPDDPLRLAVGMNFRVDPVLNRYCDQHHIHETSLWKQGTGLELIYVVRLKNAEDLPQVVVDLSQTEGILGVELKRS